MLLYTVFVMCGAGILCIPENVRDFYQMWETPASTGGEYNKLVSVAGVNPPSAKHSAGALNVQWTFA